MIVAQVDTGPLETFGRQAAEFLPEFLAFLAILVIGYLVAKAIAKIVDKVLERVGFDRAVERGGIRKALGRTQYDASDLLSKLILYTLMLFVLQMAFGVFGPNPVSDLIYAVIAYLPLVFAAIVVVVVASAVAAAVREIVDVALGGLSYGRLLANVSSIAIIAIGVFMALNLLNIAPAIVNGLFYATLAIIAGSAIIAIGGGGIQPMRAQWEKALNRLEQEAPRIKEQAQSTTKEDVKARAELRKRQASGVAQEPTAETQVIETQTIRLPEEETTGRR